ncbi:hypothetical protein [Mycobacterium sp. DL592]|uniref:hypothetical protein n=1 Tax=Mycobacterium sp. DL592 TaxID=2675524 RepID=UPI00141FF828|nr:hypothetical protein [Mycobacterium sp. DL592]
MSDDAVDSLVWAVDPGLPAPAITRREVVLVTGPWLAGTTSVADALRDRVASHTFVETADLGPGDAPAAVVFVVSATAPLTESDCELLDAAAADTDTVIGVVAKIDVHRTWRDVLEANRALLAAHAARYRDLTWVGAAPAPDLGEPVLDDLVAAISEALARPDLERRNRLRAWDSRLSSLVARLERDAAGVGPEARLAALSEHRAEVLHRRRVEKTERAIALRSRVQQARVQLSYFARGRCTSVRAELQDDAASLSRRGRAPFVDYVRRRVAEVVDEVDEGISIHLADVGRELALPLDVPAGPPLEVDVSGPPLRSRRLETRLMVLLGAGFGLGVALTVSRFFAGVAPQWTAAGAVGAAALGIVLTLWVVGTRGLLHDRALLDRWVSEVVAGLRAALEERVATRVLAAESVLSSAAAERDARDAAAHDKTLSAVDREIREHAQARAQASTERDKRMPVIRQAIEVVTAELAVAG